MGTGIWLGKCIFLSAVFCGAVGVIINNSCPVLAALFIVGDKGLTGNYRTGAFYSGRYLRKISFMQFSSYSKIFPVSLIAPTKAAMLS